jgi:hypothetical protein
LLAVIGLLLFPIETADSLQEDGLPGADGLLEEDEQLGEDEQDVDRMTWPT